MDSTILKFLHFPYINGNRYSQKYRSFEKFASICVYTFHNLKSNGSELGLLQYVRTNYNTYDEWTVYNDVM